MYSDGMSIAWCQHAKTGRSPMGCYKLSIIEGLDVQAIPGDWQEDSQHSGEILESKNTSKRF
jgi:hypothetical protein